MKRRSEHPEAAPWQLPHKSTGAGGISQVFSAVDIQKNVYNQRQVQAVWNNIKQPQV
jgi:hypothetical protein